MTILLPTPVGLPPGEFEAARDDDGLGALRTERGNLPLESIDVAAQVTGLTARVVLSQRFRNPHDVPLEATYVFPLPPRAAVTAMRMEADDRVIDGVLKERGQARADYRQAIAEGRRASLAEEERPDVFTVTVGNILPGEAVTVRLTMDQPLPYADGEATFRFPLVVAPRYVPGAPLGGGQVGAGVEPDTDAVPDASRISPPVLLPGFPNPVALTIGVDVDPGGLPLSGIRSSLHAVCTEGRHLSIRPGERADRDLVLRLAYGRPGASTHALLVGEPDEDGERTFRLTVLPPADVAPPRPRDVVLVLDRSGSMGGWKMVAARRAAARIVDTFTDADRFAVLAFDSTVERPAGLPSGLVAATDRNRYRAVEHLARTEARGGTEMLRPLTEAVDLLTADDSAARDRVLVLVTDGQVGNEDQMLTALAPRLAGVRVHTIGIDRAVNEGFLGRLATIGGGRFELVESEDRLDEAAEHVHRRICGPLVTDLVLRAPGVVAGSVAPARLPALFPGVPLVVAGRCTGDLAAAELTGTDAAGAAWTTGDVAAEHTAAPSIGSVWARAHLRDLEDAYLVARRDRTGELERRIVATSLRFGVLCRFTAYVAVDSRVVTDGAEPHRVTQPVEPASGWDMLAGGPPVAAAPMMAASFTPMAMGARGAAEGAFQAPGGMVQGGVAPGGLPAMPPPAAPARARGGAGGGGFAGMGREQAKRAAESAARPAPDPLAWARTQAGQEASALRGHDGAPADELWRLLSGLEGRLRVMLAALDAQGVPEAGSAELRRLADDLAAAGATDSAGPGSARPGSGGAGTGAAGTGRADTTVLTALLRQAVTVLTAFAGSITPPRRGLGRVVRPNFWKR
ncbi:MAG TPA: VIT domain-containing protein [Pseudonocardiaceae bacterium]